MTLLNPRHFLVLFSILPLAWSGCGSAPSGPSAASGIHPSVSKSADAIPSNLKHYVITDYGAMADGTTLNTAFIQKAIDAATAAGGGVLEIPKGTFLSGSIFLKPGVELYLDEGAVLLGSQNIEDYVEQTTRIEGHFQVWRVALVNATNMDRVRIGGAGQLNGNGAPYWAAFRAARGAANLDVPRPRLVFIDRCQNVRVENISLQDSGFWNLHLYHCSDVHIVGLSINAPAGSPSTDGIDVDSCQNLTIQKCEISNNDDDIAIKGSKGPHADLDTDSPPDDNILIEDCTIGNGNGLLTLGSEATVVRNVLVRNCTINGNAKILTLKLRPDTPQHYSNITIDGITLNSRGSIISSAPWTQYFDLQGQPGPARSVDHITIRNVTGNCASFGSLRGNVANPQQGTLGDTLSDINFENINVNLTNPAPLTRGEVANFSYTNVVINGQPVEAPPATAAGRGGRGRGGPPGSAAAAAAAAAPSATSVIPTSASPAATPTP
jgi:hypothetical protein